ncbi:autophagy-related protein 9 [Elysia marginata]|uniref:Autophagy-related protein 9 n=1 Tax=Elysia marginata TaxID=1093978 RepID=A0AAV4HLK5_9GAST|nr:autophagy-related protein 9 [Elysia marginata]
MASDSEEIEYLALSSAPFKPTARRKGSDDSEEDEENEMFVHEEEGLLVHMTHDDNKSQWNHVDDLDKFFTSVYDYHQRHGFQNMVLAEVLQLLQFVFIVIFVTYLSYCVNYPELFDEVPHKNASHKKTLSDIVYPLGQCSSRIPFFSWLLLLLCSLFFIGRIVKMVVNFCNYLRTRNFFISALNTETSDLSNMTWHEVQIRLLEVQKEQQICIHKQELTELDIYHRILRFKNYLVAMVNKELLPLKFKLPFIGEHALLTHGMRFNLDILLYWSPWSIFVNSYTLREEYKSYQKRKQLSDQANYGRLYLRHFNELDHELVARLNRAYVPSNMYMRSFTSPLLIILAKYIAFFAGAPAAVLLVLGILDFNDVTKVEHLFTVASICGMVATVCSGLIPDENEVFCPERLMMSILAQIHYVPGHWKGKAHTTNVRDEFSMLFQYKVTYILEELLSPIFTPLWLFFCLRPRSAQIVDFFRSFTVEVSGVGDVCSFAQMDIKKHGNNEWTTPSSAEATGDSKVPKSQQGENGKIELSLMHFTSTNPEWKPPRESSNFVAGVKQEVQKDLPALTSIIADPISLPSLGYVNPIPSFFPMGTSMHHSLHHLTEQSPVAPTTPSPSGEAGSGHASFAGARLKGGLSSLDYPVVNTSQQPVSMIGSSGAGGGIASLVSNTGSFYSADFNSLSLLDEGQREMLSGNMSLSVLHLYETQHRRRLHGGSLMGGGRESHGLTHATSAVPGYLGSHGKAAKAEYGSQYQVDRAGTTKHEQYQFSPLPTSSYAQSTQGYQASATDSGGSTPVGGVTAGTILSYPHDTVRNVGAGTGLSYSQGTPGSSFIEGSFGETSSLTHTSAAQEHRPLARLSNAPPSMEDTQSLAKDFNYGSTVMGGPDPLHPLAQRFKRNDELEDYNDSGTHLSRLSQSPLQASGITRSHSASASPTSPSVQGSRLHMPQIEEDMSGEQELDTSNLKPMV